MKYIAALTLAAALFGGGQLNAAIIATADFEDNTLAALGGQGGGTGWTNTWSSNLTPTVVSGGLSYLNGAVSSNGGSQAANVITGTAITGSALERKFATQTGDVYMSFLWRDSVNDTAPATGNDFAQVGFDPASDDGNPNLSFLRQNDFLNVRTGTSGASSSGTASSVGSTFMVVLKATPTGGNYDADLWVNPSSATEVGSDVSATTAGISNIGTFLSRVAFGETGDAYQIDNIRIGTQWSDVVLAPYVVIAQYDLTVGSNVAQDAADVVGPNTTAGNFQAFIDGSLSTNPGVGGAGISSGNGNAFLDRNLTGTTTTAATDDYLTFTVTPDAGFEFEFGNITFDFLVQQTSGISYTYELRSSIDSFNSVLGTATNDGAAFTLNEIIDLTALSPQSSPVEFRFMFSDTDDGAGIQHRIDNVQLFGTISAVVIPEPSTFALSALGLLSVGMIGWRGRRR